MLDDGKPVLYADCIGKATQGEGRTNKIIILSFAIEGGGIVDDGAMNMRAIRMYGYDESMLTLRPAHGGFIPDA